MGNVEDQIEHILTEECGVALTTSMQVANRIRALANAEASSNVEMAKVVIQDPGLSAAVLRRANAILLNPLAKRVVSVREAIQRIGGNAVVCLAYAVSLQRDMAAIKRPEYRALANRIWSEAATNAGWAFCLAREVPREDPDVAMMCALMRKTPDLCMVHRLAQITPMVELEVAESAIAEMPGESRAKVLDALGLPDDLMVAIRETATAQWPPSSLGEVLALAEQVSCAVAAGQDEALLEALEKHRECYKQIIETLI